MPRSAALGMSLVAVIEEWPGRRCVELTGCVSVGKRRLPLPHAVFAWGPFQRPDFFFFFSSLSLR